MQNQNRPASPQVAPDPSNNYERSHPEREAGQGRLDNNISTPTNRPDHEEEAVHNRQNPDRQINAQETEDERSSRPLAANLPPPEPVDHSMKDEEPMGWDQAPTDIHDPRQARHSRQEGKGGTPDAGEDKHNSQLKR